MTVPALPELDGGHDRPTRIRKFFNFPILNIFPFLLELHKRNCKETILILACRRATDAARK